jgi:hypothetical protein
VAVAGALDVRGRAAFAAATLIVAAAMVVAESILLSLAHLLTAPGLLVAQGVCLAAAIRSAAGDSAQLHRSLDHADPRSTGELVAFRARLTRRG